jgi:hypothetical protein
MKSHPVYGVFILRVPGCDIFCFNQHIIVIAIDTSSIHIKPVLCRVNKNFYQISAKTIYKLHVILGNQKGIDNIDVPVTIGVGISRDKWRWFKFNIVLGYQ